MKGVNNLAKPYPLKFAPIAQERIWGGDKLKTWFSTPPLDGPVGEYWVLSGHPNGTSIAVNGEFEGKSLNELLELYPEAYLGKSPQPRFPLLIKFLEATTDLSVQIHPDDAYAQTHEGDFGKTEAWFVLECDEAGQVNYGHKFSNQEEYFQAVREGRVKEFLRYEPISAGSVVFVPSRTMHALLAGTIVVEIQQTSDVTYRVYDWDRVDVNGNSRELHVEKAADVMQYGGMQKSALCQTRVLEQTSTSVHEELVRCDYFTLERLQLWDKKKQLTRGTISNPDILIVVDGSVELCWEEGCMSLGRGDTVLIPATITNYHLVPNHDAALLRTFY